MRIIWGTVALLGFALSAWAAVSLPEGTVLFPVPIAKRTSAGPYRWLRHPMYLGNWMLITGCAGLAAGFWNAIAVGTLAELLMREWAWRETRKP